MPSVQRRSSPQPADVPYRLSDVERDEAITALGDAFAEGRLDHGEFEVRLEAASRAVLASDLDPLFADLPRSRAVKVPAPSVSRRPGPARTRSHHGPPLGALLLFVLAVVTHAWLLVPLAFIVAGHRRRGWAPRTPGPWQGPSRRPYTGSPPSA